MPKAEITIRGKRGQPPMKVRVGAMDEKGEIELQCEQSGTAIFIACTAPQWQRIIDAIKASQEDQI